MKSPPLQIGALDQAPEGRSRQRDGGRRWAVGMVRGFMATFLAGLASAALILPADAAAGEATRPAGWSTHCVGRFLIDLPRDAKTRASFTSGGARISTMAGVNAARFRAQVGARESELRSARRNDGGSMLVERYALTPSHEVLVSWSSPAGRRVYRYEEFQYFPDSGALFRFESEGNANASSMEQARAAQKRFGAAVRTRGAGEIPRDAGFCIEDGFVAGSQLNREEVEVGILPGRMSHTRIDLTGFVTRNPEPPLSRRIHKGGGVRVISQKHREIDGMPGDEVVIAEGNGRSTRHEFVWEFPGTPDSLAAPFLKLSMSLEAGAFGEGGDFPDLAAATQFWNDMLASLRRRPGAT